LQSRHKLASSQPIKPTPTESSNDTAAPFAEKPKKRKRDKADNEIDALFNASFHKRVKKGALQREVKVPSATEGFADEHAATLHPVKDKVLDDVLGAIRAAPKDEKGGHGKKKLAR
jgi:nucleolar protein 9